MTTPGRTIGADDPALAHSAESEPAGRSRPSDALEGEPAAPAAPRSRPTIVRPSNRERRAEARRRVRRRRRSVAAGAAVVAVVAAVATGLAPDLVRDGWRRLVPVDGPPTPFSEPHTLLLAWEAGEGGSAALVLLGAAPETSRGGALLMPGRTQVEVPSFGSQTLATALGSAGADGVALAVENALGYDVGAALELDEAAWTALLEPTAPLEVRLRDPVQLGDRSFGTGRQMLTAAEAARVLVTPQEDSGELDHLVVVHAVLEGWLARLDGDALGLTEEALTDRLRAGDDRAGRTLEVLDAVSRRRVSFDTLDVVSMGLPEGEGYTLDEEGAAEELGLLFPGLAFRPDGDRVRVEVLNGTGRAGIAFEAAERVIPAGARVVLSGNAARFGLEKTLVVLQDARFEADGRRLIDALGAGELRMARDPVGVADVTIVVGSDFAVGRG